MSQPAPHAPTEHQLRWVPRGLGGDGAGGLKGAELQHRDYTTGTRGAPHYTTGVHSAWAALPAAFGGHDSDDSERGGDDDFNDNCEVPASEDAEMMEWDTYDDDYVGS